MQGSELPELTIARAETDADLEAMVDVRRRVDPEVRPSVAGLRHNLATSEEGLVYLLARLGPEPVACGFVEAPPDVFAHAQVEVVPERRRRGVGSALLTEVSCHARRLGKEELQFEVRESDVDSRSFLERRGYRRGGAEKAVSLDLAGVGDRIDVPPGIAIVSRAERPDLLEGMYAVSLEAEADIPGNVGTRTFSAWRAHEIDRPSRRAELSFVALAGDEVVGFASLDVFGNRVLHGLTAVKRAWRRRGVATALKRAEIAAARRAGFERLLTGSEERNLPMQRLNEKLGFRPDSEHSVVVMRGPLA
jgi:mycothiol synthase